ncbi:GL10215 [Drosophila persimilis]|uniref:Diacylglycerol kinase n=2 Tax=pseudoobscura subgroup TaxID=32358 RepID=A0A6I8UW69_DROPS|nr:diacylglycerol kinase epsilon [Drosophila pseudoobscura]XP_002025976.1 diacylglycerol kinase epsilon [Drosophila persimilis]EDW32883.1 GL10215 [Drosophila persimilis]
MDIAAIDLSVEALIGSLLALGVLFAFCRSILAEDVVISILSGKSRHSWKSIKIIEQACFCNVCEILMTPSAGLFCDCCGLCTHATPVCQRQADRGYRCKDKWLRNETSVRHLWVHGNLPMGINCSACGDEVDHHASTDPGLYGWRCAWCQRCYHDDCYKEINVKDECDFGEFKDMIFPPYSFVAARTRDSMRLHLASITPPDIENWEPLIVIANTKSGSSTGADVLSLLRGYLHPMQVMELGSRGPQDALQWAAKASPRPCRILVAGGDGTIGWVMNTIYALNIKPQPSVAIMPLGTGNDLSRVLGWGAEPPTVLDPVQILRSIRRARSINLDRYDLQIEKLHYRLPIQRHPTKTVHVYNYFSVGVDAYITYNFHKTRESRFYLLSSRIFNKLLYFTFGTQQVMQPGCERIEEKLTLYLDNKPIQLPELQALVFLNIDSWGAGCKLCELSNSNGDTRIVNSISDGVMEVFGIVSSFHIAQLQCNISKPVRIGQAKQIRLQVKETVPMQADGEPWMQSPADIRLQARSQARVLKLDPIST